MSNRFMLFHGDSLNVLKRLKSDTVDAVITDPPYGLAFMGKKWDYDVPAVEIWKEVLRVLKPGGHLLSFGGTRTYHRMVVAIEDAGFEIRDQIQWLYGSGFPKSLDISKAIDKAAGAEREVIGSKIGQPGYHLNPNEGNGMFGAGVSSNTYETKLAASQITAPSTDAAKQYAGWGTALKPANEPIVLARKPLSEKTVAANVLKWGTGGLNIDATRVGTDLISTHGGGNKYGHIGTGINDGVGEYKSNSGRFPANVILDEAAGEMLDRQVSPSDLTGPSRFFYVAKAGKRERNKGLEKVPVKAASECVDRDMDSAGINNPRAGANRTSGIANFHPTVKPVALMEYLCKLITPTNGIVLDPFMGSGTTGVAAINLNLRFIGIEREEEYLNIAKARVGNEQT